MKNKLNPLFTVNNFNIFFRIYFKVFNSLTPLKSSFDLHNAMLEKEFQYYLKHEKEFIEKYPDRFIMILNERLVGVYDTEEAAYYDMVEKNITVPVLVQQCTNDSVRTSLFN